MLKIIILAITSFIGSNIDDLIIDIFFFMSVKGKKDICNIVLGKYLGIGALVIISIGGSIGLGVLPTEYMGYLGVIPMILGIKELIGNMQNTNKDEEAVMAQTNSNMLWNIAFIGLILQKPYS